MERMTKRQGELLHRLRYELVPLEADMLGAVYGYAYPRAACDRLVARGLVEKVRPGVYRAVVVRERRASSGWPESARRRPVGICPRCGERTVKVELIAQARSTKRPKPGLFASRARRVCEPCGQVLFAAMLAAMELGEDAPRPAVAGLGAERGD